MNYLKYLIPIVCCLILVSCLYSYYWADNTVCKITDKGIKRFNDGKETKDIYMIYTDKIQFRNQDIWYRWKFNSADVYAKLQINHCYNIKHIGWRIGFFSMFPNITKAKEVKCE